MNRIPRIFQFSMPFTKLQEGTTPIHRGDLIINATLFMYSDGALLRDDNNDPVIEINWLQWNEELVTETFIQEFLPDMHKEIIAAAKNNANNSEQVKELPVENGAEADEQSGIWMADQAERAIYEHENNY